MIGAQLLDQTDVAVFVKTYRHQEYAWQFTVPPAVTVDAGAYTGLSAVYFATRYPDARIVAVEPSQIRETEQVRWSSGGLTISVSLARPPPSSRARN